MSHSFGDHVALLGYFLSGREHIVDTIERRLLNVRSKSSRRDSTREVVEDIVNRCFFESPHVPRDAVRLKDQLAAAHRADGFEPTSDGYLRELDVMQLVLRAHHEWDRDRWPGRNGRVAYAESLFAMFMLRQLEHLSLRIWDDGHETADDRLRQVQHLLDLLNTAGAATFIRDARWLIQTAQGPLTRELRPYFTIAGRVCKSFTHHDRVEIHKAGAVLAGGHMRSQLRHRSRQTGWPVDDPQTVALTHLSNSMDMALLVHDLIPLLDAYSVACAQDDAVERLALADAILQGLSADPELLLTRLDLLAPSTMIEELFVDQGSQARYTDMGEAHLERLRNYQHLIGRTAQSLMNDALSFDPLHAMYSPLGIVYGFCSDLSSNMVLAALRSSPFPDVSLEDMFNSQGPLEQKRMAAELWRSLPKVEGERDAFEHSIEWATQMFLRMFKCLEARATNPTHANASGRRDARLYVVPRGAGTDSFSDGVLPAGIVSAQEHCLTSDVARARQTGSTALSSRRLLDDRSEAHFLASTNSDGEWFAVSKVPLATCISQGKHALVTDVPPNVIDVLRLVCPELLVVCDQ